MDKVFNLDFRSSENTASAAVEKKPPKTSFDEDMEFYGNFYNLAFYFVRFIVFDDLLKIAMDEDIDEGRHSSGQKTLLESQVTLYAKSTEYDCFSTMGGK